MPKIDPGAVPAEAILISGAVVVIGAGLFEWVVISPEQPGHAVLRVLCAGLAATLALLPFQAP